MRRLKTNYRLWTQTIAIAAMAIVAIPGMARAQCASGGGMGGMRGGGGGTGGATATGGAVQFGGSTAQMAFAMQMMQMQEQAQMRERMRQRMMSGGNGQCMESQSSQAFSSGFRTMSPTTQTQAAPTRPSRPLTEIQRHRIEREEARQLVIQERIAEREQQTAERIAAHEQHLAQLRAHDEAD